ncbi:MAG: OmpW family outer membrane protein [Bacteroidota bacterium]
MKKLFLLFLVFLFVFDFAEAKMAYSVKPASSNEAGISNSDDFSSLLAKKRRRKKKKSSKKGGSDLKAIAGVGLIYTMPMGNFKKSDTAVGSIGVKGGIGINVDGEYFVNPSFSVGANTGMYNFSYDTKNDSLVKFDKSTYKIIPLNLKGTFYFGKGPLRPFFGINLGMNIISSKINFSVNQDSLWLRNEKIDKMTKFGLAPMVGILYDITDQLLLNVNLRYESISAKDKKYGFNNATFMGVHFGILYTF